MKLFITGSDGFIGSELVSQCKNLGIEVIGADVKSSFDICSKDIANHIPEGVDAVVHLAGLSNDTQCKNNGYKCFDINVLGTLNLMEAAAARKVKQFIFASTEWIYDSCTAQNVKSEESPINVANHTSEYAFSKLVSETNLRQKYQHGFMPVTILRFGIVFGTTGEKKSAVESLYLNVKEDPPTGGEVSVGSLKSGRCFIHVSDIASGIIKAVGLNGFNIINLVGDKLVTLRNIIDISKNVLKKNPKVIETTPGNISVRNISNAKAKKMLNWFPKIGVETWLKVLAKKTMIKKKKIAGISEFILHKHEDDRGFVARIYDDREFKKMGFPTKWREVTLQHWSKKNIIRGCYLQSGKYSESKLLRVTRGELMWMSVDLRKGSKTFGQHDSTILSEDKKNILYVPRGFAHGGISLSDNVDLIIQTDNYYAENRGMGFLWNDPDLNIDWGLNEAKPIVSEGHKNYPSFKEFLKKYKRAMKIET